MTYWNKYHLLNPRKEDIVSENTLLCSMVYLEKLNEDGVMKYSDEAIDIDLNVDCFVSFCKFGYYKIWFNNLPFESTVPQDQFTSPDQLNCYMLWDHKNARKIFWTLVTHLGTYDNISKKINFKRFMQPMTLFLAGYLGFSKVLFFLPLWIAMNFSCLKGTNSGKQKVWLILKYAFDKKMFDLFNKKYDLDKAIRDYYPEDHPINLLGV